MNLAYEKRDNTASEGKARGKTTYKESVMGKGGGVRLLKKI